MTGRFSEKSLRHRLHFAEAFSDERIVSALMRQLSWTHFLSIIYLRDPLQREFYAIALARKRLENSDSERIAENVGKLLEGE